MQKVLVINSGSSSIKYQLFRRDDWSALAAGAVTRIGERAAEVKSEWLDARGERHSSRIQAPIETHADGIDRIILALAGQFAREHDATAHPEDIDRILKTFVAFQSVDKYAYRATLAEVRENEYNLNIPRYVDTFEEEAEIDLGAVKKEITGLEKELTAVRAKMDGYLKELGL